MNMQILTPYVISSSGRLSRSCQLATPYRTCIVLVYSAAQRAYFGFVESHDLATTLVPSSLEMADESKTASSTFYEVDEECVDSPFESSSSSDSDDEVVMTDVEEEQDEGDPIVETAGGTFGAEPYQFEPQVQRSARLLESAQHVELDANEDDQRMAGNLWYVSILYSNLICCIMLTIYHKIIPVRLHMIRYTPSVRLRPEPVPVQCQWQCHCQ